MPGKRKGPSPEEERKQLEELKQVARDEYLKLFRKEQARSAARQRPGGQQQPGKVPGFDPHPQQHIADEEVDRLIIRRGVSRAAWEDPADDEPVPADVAGDPEGTEVQEQLRQAQADLQENLRLIQCEVDGVESRGDLVALEQDACAVEDAIDADQDQDAARNLASLKHDFFASNGTDTEIAVMGVVSVAETVQALWKRRKQLGMNGGLMNEICTHLGVSRGRLTLLQQSLACRYAEKNPGRTYAELLVLFLYSCEPEGLERVLCVEGTAMPPIHLIINKALRDRDLKTMFDWICFICVLMGCSLRLASDKVGRTVHRGVTGLSPEQLSTLKQAKAEDLHFLPPLCSFSFEVDAAVGDEFRQPDAAVFTIRGVRAGADLTNLAQFGKDQEVLMPPLCCLRVKEPPKTDQGLRLQYEYVGAMLHTTPTGELPYFKEEQRRAFRSFTRDVRDHCRTLDKEFRLLQRYQRTHRKLQQHRAALHELAEAISSRDAERDAAQKAIDMLPRGAKPPPGMTKPEDVQVLLDADKCKILETLINQQRTEQGRLERELVALKGAIDGGTEELMRTDVDTVDPDLRPLLKLQTEHYNNMVRLYEKDNKNNEKLDARVAAVRPVDAKKKKAKGGK
eukprot:TRINITY_DN15274_c0_g1_i1.p1 TRINITY_DN15274_c0_g1~~TRINITY_DN15274_c0_g1_i1.p1  ORF type:complete len:624 (+),score=180.51 TRINITY_DN15274_c0_g1_i1:132-2003(+)